MNREKLMAVAIVLETMATEIQRAAMCARVTLEHSNGREERLIEANAKLTVAKALVSTTLRSLRDL